MRLTRQKIILNSAINAFNSFFSAEDIYQRIKGKNLSLATVYRFLKNLEETGEVHSYLCNSRKIYSCKKDNHIHFTCEKCGLVKHLTVKTVDFLQEITDDNICHFQVDVTGICRDCLKD